MVFNDTFGGKTKPTHTLIFLTTKEAIILVETHLIKHIAMYRNTHTHSFIHKL